jgi:hypoxanthine phosphoribosyltransferase
MTVLGGELQKDPGEPKGGESSAPASEDRLPVRALLFSEVQISERVRELAAEIEGHYPPDEDLLVLGLLKGSFIFLADLIRSLRRPLQVEFLGVSSYGSGQTSSGEVRLLQEVPGSLMDRHVLLVEDIVDSGRTLEVITPVLLQRAPRSLEVCTLLHKRQTSGGLAPRWVGFECPNRFVVGYGLDHAENLRHLPYIGSL